MKTSTLLFAALSLFAISNSFAAETPAYGKAEFVADMNHMQKLSATELFLEDNYADQNSVDLPGVHCVKDLTKTMPVVTRKDNNGGVTFEDVPYGPAFKCSYTN